MATAKWVGLVTTTVAFSVSRNINCLRICRCRRRMRILICGLPSVSLVLLPHFLARHPHVAFRLSPGEEVVHAAPRPAAPAQTSRSPRRARLSRNRPNVHRLVLEAITIAIQCVTDDGEADVARWPRTAAATSEVRLTRSERTSVSVSCAGLSAFNFWNQSFGREYKTALRQASQQGHRPRGCHHRNNAFHERPTGPNK